MRLWNIINGFGLRAAISFQDRRHASITNKISTVTCLLSIVLMITYGALYPWNLITSSMPIVGILALAPIFLNAAGRFNLSRIWLSLLLPVSCIIVSVISKKLIPTQDSEYYEFRYVMLTASIFPLILFNAEEKKPLIFTIVVSIGLLLSYDVIHNALDVGYYQMGLTDTTYYYTNVVLLATYLALLGAILFLKRGSEESERRNINLIEDLNGVNKELEQRNKEMETQHQEIMIQSKILSENQRKLSDAYDLIEQQKDLLSRQNKTLEYELIEKNKELTQTNSELIKYNTELRQLSYTVSHNLRGPVASLLGLLNLLDFTQITSPNRELIDYIKESALQLDSIIGDLKKIIDIRHDIFRVRQKVDIKDEIAQIVQLLGKSITKYKVTIDTDLKVESLYSVKPMVHSILYNLISNSIKYRSPNRLPIISVSTSENVNYYLIKVTDNGLGIDLAQHRDNLFRLYKRFHLHTDGKGLGLYLVKLQCESLGGFIDVDSVVNGYTSFTVYLKKPDNINRQILYERPEAQIFFDATINSTGVFWHGPMSSVEYRNVFNKCLDFLNVYNTPNWLSDLTNQGPIPKEDQLWMFQEIIPTAVKNGLKRIATIGISGGENLQAEYIDNIYRVFSKYPVTYQHFETFAQAVEWVKNENEKSMVI